MVIDSKAGEAGSAPVRPPRRSFTEDLSSTFSSPLAWILVLALIITWSCVFVIMFDLMDYKTVSDRPPLIRKVLKDSGRRGGLSKMRSDPLRVVNDAVEESTNLVSAVLNFAASLIAPDEEDGGLYAVRKKGEFLPSRSKVIGMQAKEKLPAIEVEEEGEELGEEEGEETDEVEAPAEEEKQEELEGEEDEEEEDDEGYDEEYDDEEYDEEYDDEEYDEEYDEEEYDDEEYDEGESG
ncbi:unnamed protein product [Menidia menidia]|uniref:Triadin n=1 Tax=Menidia menidia TaxID=238744 RepID=A0A8S4B551_9TELE|nr:unnamed protein product [Menidia menidia]